MGHPPKHTEGQPQGIHAHRGAAQEVMLTWRASSSLTKRGAKVAQGAVLRGTSSSLARSTPRSGHESLQRSLRACVRVCMHACMRSLIRDAIQSDPMNGWSGRRSNGRSDPMVDRI